MADMTKQENIQTIRTLLDAYGVAVRAGVITPCLQDENAFRAMIGLAAAPQEVIRQWEATNGIRLTITLQKSLAEGQAQGESQSTAGEENAEQ